MFGIQGIYPDLLHILDLALYTDMIASTFLEWSEPGIFEGRSRDDRLLKLFAWYREWCRENRSLFFWDCWQPIFCKIEIQTVWGPK